MSSAHPDDVDAHQCRVAIKRVYFWHAKQLAVWREVLPKSAETAGDVAYWHFCDITSWSAGIRFAGCTGTTFSQTELSSL